MEHNVINVIEQSSVMYCIVIEQNKIESNWIALKKLIFIASAAEYCKGS